MENCKNCGSKLGLDCGDAEPDYNENFCSVGCMVAMPIDAELSYTDMTYLEAVEVVKMEGKGDLLEGMHVCKEMTEPPYFRNDDRSVAAFNIVREGMNKLFNGGE